MTDDEIRAWLTEEIEREERHVAEGGAGVWMCQDTLDRSRDLLHVINAARPNIWARAMGAK